MRRFRRDGFCAGGGFLEICAADADHRRQAFHQPLPGFAFVARGVELAAARAKINSGGIEGVGGHGIAQNGFVRAFLRQAARERFPGGAGIARAVDAETTVAGAAKFVGLNRDDIDAIRFLRMHDDRETKIGRDAVGDVFPVFAAIVRAIQAPMILQE